MKSRQPPQQLLSSITSRLALKGEPFSEFEGASDDEIEAFWEILHLVDDSLYMADTSKSTLEGKPKLQAFTDHCCQIRHYSFCIKKYGSSECEICKPVRMESERFKHMHFLSDPVMGADDHYKPFVDVYGTCTTEDDRPFMIQRRKTKALTYSPSEHCACNTGIVIQCDESDKRRLLFSKRKLTIREHAQLEQIVVDISYTCGATTDDLILSDTLQSVGLHSHNCSDPIEKIYYSAYKDDLICITAAPQTILPYLPAQIY